MASQLDALASVTETLLRIVSGDHGDPGGDNVGQILEILRSQAMAMNGADQDLALLAIQSIILKCASVRVDMTRDTVAILTSLLMLHCDLVTNDDMIPNIVTTLEHNQLAPGPWLHIVTCLSNEIFLHHPAIIVTGHYWSQVQAGLMSEDAITRKRATFLMKRSLDTLTSDQSTLDDHSGLLHFTDKRKARDLFDSFFLIYETLEEKQVHLVRQVLPKLELLLESVTSSAESSPPHSSWILILFLRVFKHPNISVVRWGVTMFLHSTFPSQVITNQHFLSFVCNPLLEVLNQTKLYAKDSEEPGDEQTGAIISKKFNQFLQLCCEELESEGQSLLTRTLIVAISSKSWAPIPLTWLSFAVSNVQCQERCLTSRELESVRSLVDTQMQYQEPLLRAAAQTNFCYFVLNNINISEIDVDELTNFLFVFWTKKVLVCDRTSKLSALASHQVVGYFQNDYSRMLTYIENKIVELRGMKTTPTMIAEQSICKLTLLVGLFLTNRDFDVALVKDFKDRVLLKREDNRAYQGDRYQYSQEEWTRSNLFCLNSIFKIFQDPPKRDGKEFLAFIERKDHEKVDVIKFLNLDNEDIIKIMTNVVDNVKELLEAEEDIENIWRADIYINLLARISGYIKCDTVEDLINVAIKYCATGSKIQKVISLRIFSSLCQNGYNTPLHTEQFLEAFDGNTSLLSEEEREQIQNRDQQKVWGKLCGEYLSRQLDYINFHFENGAGYIFQQPDELLARVSRDLETGGRECLVSCIRLATSLQLPCSTFIELAKRYIFEFRKNEVFWPALRLFIKLCLDNLDIGHDSVVDIFLELIEESETVAAIFPALMKCVEEHFQAHSEGVSSFDKLLPVLARALTHGPVFRKDQKLVSDTNQFIFSLGAEFEGNYVEGSDHLMVSCVRVDAIKTVFMLAPSSAVLVKLFRELQTVNTEVTGKRTRHFENSIIHKVRQRIYQSYLLLLPLLSPEDGQLVLEEVGQCVMGHGEQTSVRYYCEWIVTCLVLRQSESVTSVLSWLDTAGASKPGAVPSFLIILTQVIMTMSTVTGDMVEQSLTKVSPWCMAQNFYTRIVAQLCFRKLWTRTELFPDLVTKYQPLYDCITMSVNPANADKLHQDFYLTVFDPVTCYTMTDILHHFPRLCDISQDELLPLELIRTINTSSPLYAAVENELSVLKTLTKKTNRKSTESKSETGVGMNIQRKITPWSWMMTDSDLGLQSSRSGHRRAHPHLIVVASLIDKAPNLGGLARTCEILGVGCMLVASANIVRDKEFAAVSVTAEHWLPIEECQPHKLANYLQESRAQGYKILAVEQTSDSVPLHQVQFPDKSVLLLGKEKEGVPVELLNLVDDCVEIPQHGLIRSFNVHVTGALVIWEYVKQQSHS